MSYENKLKVSLGLGSGGTHLGFGFGLGGVHPDGRLLKSVESTFLAVSIFEVYEDNLSKINFNSQGSQQSAA